MKTHQINGHEALEMLEDLLKANDRIKELETENETVKEENFDYCARIKELEEVMQEMLREVESTGWKSDGIEKVASKIQTTIGVRNETMQIKDTKYDQ